MRRTGFTARKCSVRGLLIMRFPLRVTKVVRRDWLQLCMSQVMLCWTMQMAELKRCPPVKHSD